MKPTSLRTTGHSVLTALSFVLSLALLVTPVARADDQPSTGGGEGISVAGSGEVKAKPKVVEINATVTGDAELAADAIVKYRDARRRAVAALNGLKLEGLKIDSNGFSVAQGMDTAQMQAMMQGNTAPAGKQRVSITEQLKLNLTVLDRYKDEELMDTVLKLLDTGRDAGLVIGRTPPRNYYEMQMYYNNGGASQGNLVSFKLVDTDGLREQAYKMAMDDAKKKAERLANLAGVKLGRILSVKDAVAVGGNNSNNGQMAWMAMYGVAMQPEQNELTSNVFKEISVKVNLAVQFEIAK
jgi:uncharacterized protein YggE